MEFNLTKSKLTLYLSGKVDSNNAEQTDSEIANILNGKAFDSLVIDAKGLQYVSSAGLRIFLKLAKTYQDFKIVNVSIEVFEIFEMTGFSSIMKVEKAMREVSIEGAELIGEGFCSKVYRLNKDTLIKVMTTTTDLDDITRELNLCKQAFILGLPTSISFDVVKVGDRYGVIFEMLDCLCLRDWILKEPDSFDEYVDLYAHLLLKINSTDHGDFAIPNALEAEKEHASVLKGRIDDDDYDYIFKLLNTIPEARTLVHGDCHIKNIMYDKKDISLIDMDTLSYGNPIFELCAICATYIVFEETEPGNVLRFMKLEKEKAKELYTKVLRIYFQNLSEKDFEENLKKIKLMTYIHMLHWTARFETMMPERFDISYNLFKQYKNDVKDLNLKF